MRARWLAARPAEYRRVASACTGPRLCTLPSCLAAASRGRQPRMARPIAGLAVRLGLAPAVSSRTNMIPGIPAHKRCAERARIVSPLQEWQTNPPACVGSEGHKQQRARVVRTKNRGLYPYTRVRGCASRGHRRAKLVTGFSRSVHKASPAGAGSLLPGRHYACRRKGARSRLAHLPRLPSPLSGRFAPAPGALWGHQSLAGCPPAPLPGLALQRWLLPLPWRCAWGWRACQG